MSSTGVSRANAQRAIRREALREQLSNQGHAQHVVDLLEKLTNLSDDYTPIEVQRMSKALEIKMKIIAKYLPDDKEPTDVNLGAQDLTPVLNVFMNGEKE